MINENNIYNKISKQISNQFIQTQLPLNDKDIISYSNIVNFANPQINQDNNNNYNNQLQTQINEIKMNYESKIAKLQNKLNKEKNNNKGLIDENNILKEKNKVLENNVANKEKEFQKFISQKPITNKSAITSIKPGEEILGVNFVSIGKQAISNYNLVCKNTDLFVRLEERLYEDFPEFKEYETYFEVKTRRIKRFKTLKENNIKTNDVINVFINDN